MHQRYNQLIKNQPKVKVMAQAHNNTVDKFKFTLLAAISAGIFYFFGYNLWHALSGG